MSRHIPAPLSLAWRSMTAAMVAIACAFPVAASQVSVVDDIGRKVVLDAPARRIVSLAPNVTELLFSVDAGSYIVGTARFSDYPEAAKRIPLVGDATMINLERIVSLKPDLIVVWHGGNSPALTDKLRVLGVPIYYSDPKRLADIPKALADMGRLAGTEPAAARAAADFRQRSESLRGRYSGKPPVRVFYQVWDRPLMTVGSTQMISDAIALCGGTNVFASLGSAAPTISREAVVKANPDAIVTSYGGRGDDGLDGWRKLRGLRATARGNLFALNTPTLGRQSPRTLDGVALLCQSLDEARTRSAPPAGNRSR